MPAPASSSGPVTPPISDATISTPLPRFMGSLLAARARSALFAASAPAAASSSGPAVLYRPHTRPSTPDPAAALARPQHAFSFCACTGAFAPAPIFPLPITITILLEGPPRILTAICDVVAPRVRLLHTLHAHAASAPPRPFPRPGATQAYHHILRGVHPHAPRDSWARSFSCAIAAYSLLFHCSYASLPAPLDWAGAAVLALSQDDLTGSPP
ncbi:hypothetical protein B0H19DRAFT_1258326 [Mycena capillaripes]|nr:hypothetical protein B0H19DRAFT_1258326 [Mycena capillaripes]